MKFWLIRPFTRNNGVLCVIWNVLQHGCALFSRVDTEEPMTDETARREDGMNAGARNIGRFFLAAIPWVLGMAAAVWFGVWIEGHNYRKQLSQEDRAASYVGATDRPKAKIKIEVLDKSCVKITRADIDGKRLLIYTENNCEHSMDYLEWHWQLISPDGTAIKSGYANTASCAVPMIQGDKAECSFGDAYWDDGIPQDDRAAKIRVWVGR